MNTGLPRWTKWLIMLAFVGVFAGGALYFIQNEVQKQVRTALEDQARAHDAVLTIQDVRYNLISNVLTLTGTELKFSMNGQPMTYRIEQTEVISPNRPLVMALTQQKLDDVRGIQPAADAVDLRNITIDAGTAAVTTVALQRVEGLSLNMDVVRDFLAAPNPTFPKQVMMVAEAVAYKTRIVSGVTSTVKEDGLSVVATAANMVEKDVANLALDSIVVSDVAIKVQTDVDTVSFTLKKMGVERLTLSREFLELALTGDLQSPEVAARLLKSLFLGERPFMAALTFDDMLLVSPEHNVPLKSFRYENSSTNPFAARLELKGLTLPTAALLSGPALALVADMPTLTYSTSLNLLVPYNDPKALTKFATQSSLDKLGSLDMELDSLVDFSQSDTAEAIDDSRLVRLKMAFTDDGLTPRAARTSKAMLGTDVTKLGALGTEFLWNMVPQEQRTPQTREMLEKFVSFLQKPGSIDLTFTPPYPMTTEEMEKANFGPEVLQITVTHGQKSLDELVQALPK